MSSRTRSTEMLALTRWTVVSGPTSCAASAATTATSSTMPATSLSRLPAVAWTSSTRHRPTSWRAARRSRSSRPPIRPPRRPWSWSEIRSINLTGNGFVNELYGNAGLNYLDGAGGGDLLVGFGGNDTYVVDDASDVIYDFVGEGTDILFVQGDYELNIQAEIELITAYSQGSTAAQSLVGNIFGQTIYGSAGANFIDGNGGADVLIGLGGGNVDQIGDFLSGTDKIALDDAVFSAIGGMGALNANAFFAGAAAHDADDRIIYDATTGNLFYDADGNGAGAAVLFANVVNHPPIIASDFTVI